jgi:hypothetical protein
MEFQAQSNLFSSQSSTRPSVLTPQPSTDSSLRGSPTEYCLGSVPTDRQYNARNSTYRYDSIARESNSTSSAPRSLPPSMTTEQIRALNPSAEYTNTTHYEPRSTINSFYTQYSVQQPILTQTFSADSTPSRSRRPIQPPVAGGDHHAPSPLINEPAGKSQTRRAPAKSDADWKLVRPRMNELYPVHTREQVKAIIEEEFNFEASLVTPLPPCVQTLC